MCKNYVMHSEGFLLWRGIVSRDQFSVSAFRARGRDWRDELSSPESFAARSGSVCCHIAKANASTHPLCTIAAKMWMHVVDDDGCVVGI